MKENHLRDWLRERFVQRLAEVLESMAGAPVRVAIASAGPSTPAAADGGLVWRQPFDLSPAHPLWLSASPGAWREVGGQALVAVGVEDADDESIRGTYLEIVSQAWSSLARDMGDRLGRQISAVDGATATFPPGSDALTYLEIQFTNRSPVIVSLAIPSAILAALDPPPTPAAGAADHASAPGASAADVRSSRTLDLLLDVEMPVSVSFGRLMVALKDVLKLTSGSVIELNRTVSEPVEIIVNNCVIARGDVVVIEGNYGVRIQSIVSSQERLRTLA